MTYSREQLEVLAEKEKHLKLIGHLRAVLNTTSGQEVIKFLLDDFGAFDLPPRMMEGSQLHEALGFLRAGKSLFNLICETNPEMAGHISAKIIKERNNVQIYEPTQSSENGFGE